MGINFNYLLKNEKTTLSLTYQVTEKLSLSPGYTFSQRENSPPVRTTNNHLTWLMLTYSYPIHYQK